MTANFATSTQKPSLPQYTVEPTPCSLNSRRASDSATGDGAEVGAISQRAAASRFAGSSP